MTKNKVINALLNLYLFSITYLVIVLYIPVLYANKDLAKKLPPTPSTIYLVIGYLIILMVAIGLSFFANRAAIKSRGILVGIVLIAAVYFSLYNVKDNESTRIPLIFVVEPGSMEDLAETRWRREIPFDVYYTAYQKYPLHNIYYHPELPVSNIIELERINRFGVYLIKDEKISPSLSSSQFTSITSDSSLTRTSVWDEETEYLYFDSSENSYDLVLTTYDSKVIFIPQEFLYE